MAPLKQSWRRLRLRRRIQRSALIAKTQRDRRRAQGALTFHNVDVQPTSVVEDGGIPTDWDDTQAVSVVDVRGRVVATSRNQVQQLPSGVYVGRYGERTVKMVVVQ